MKESLRNVQKSANLGTFYKHVVREVKKITNKRPLASIQFDKIEQSEEVIYFVKDNGAGFRNKYADKIFGAFQRLHREEEYPGTGIGLATVQRIINRHGGRIWTEAEVDVGATFYFTLKPKSIPNRKF